MGARHLRRSGQEIWYGIYEMSTRPLRYASAGAPPAFVFTSAAGKPMAAGAVFVGSHAECRLLK